ncbi:hypothetical protein CTI12_AA503780 [Artemisia annua]|uniref:Myb/SANT-like DNA-binding domain-containing protein n=1 Tax=Artemisia annua TaxID=35608 RepID=A0A2U1LD24_ARTAN|nr:hypothetical protein CTI12_AA503780 [Artemisia annua]
MEGSSFIDPTQAQYQNLYQPFEQVMGQDHPSQGEPQINNFTMPASNNFDELTIILGNVGNASHLQWTHETARLLVSIISYIGEAESSDGNASSRKLKLMPIIQKWNAISNVMKERGYTFSPQQCEKKFFDMKRTYNELVGLLGRIKSCEVVENPILLDSLMMPAIQKEEVRKLLGSEQLLYHEMGSFLNADRMYLPRDLELRRSVFRNLDKEGNRKELVQNQNQIKRKDLSTRWNEVEEKSLEIQEKMLQMEKARYEWMCANRDEDLKVAKMRLENENLRLENARLAYQLKRQKTVLNVHDNN